MQKTETEYSDYPAPGETPLEAPPITPELQQFLEAPVTKSLDEHVLIHLSALNRHDRRVWCSKLMRKAGKVRGKALQAKKATS